MKPSKSAISPHLAPLSLLLLSFLLSSGALAYNPNDRFKGTIHDPNGVDVKVPPIRLPQKICQLAPNPANPKQMIMVCEEKYQ